MSARTEEARDDYQEMVVRAVLDEKTLLRLTLSKKLGDDGTPWVKISVRPVIIKGKKAIQFSYFDPKKDITKNFTGDEIRERLEEALAMPFSQIHVQTASGDIHVRVTRKGKALITKGKASRPEQEPDLTHNRMKDYLLPEDTPDAFLQALGIMNQKGEVRPSMQGKFGQINEFLKIVEQTITGIAGAGQRICVVDCGCGNAYLTFAAYHYLSHVRGLPVQAVGIDISPELIDNRSRLRDSMGWAGPELRVSRIAEYVPEEAPDLVLSLHACDTATDEAIAQGILWGSKAILAAPCCQHELHHQLQSPLFQPVLRHGILKERLADILTDALRALVLRIMGYRTSVFEFVSPEYTSKNLMIRAEKGLKPGDPASAREYQELKRYWSVSPFIEQLLGERIGRYLER